MWQNNRDIEAVNKAELQQHFDNSVAWLEKNYDRLENSRNPILWWFIKQASLASSDPKLKALFDRYNRDHLRNKPLDIWSPMFNELYSPKLPDYAQLPPMKDYQLFFLYALNCDSELARHAVIRKHITASACPLHYLNSRCVTHQLMGLRFMQRYQCGYDQEVSANIKTLQQTVVSELTWDFRVTDAYIQRVLMLVESGASDKVKPVWIKNILQAQNNDGGWDDLYPLLPLGSGKVFALSSTIPTIKTEQSSFHASAQGIWLLSQLLQQND